MTRGTIAAGALAVAIVVMALAVAFRWARQQRPAPSPPASSSTAAAASHEKVEARPGFLQGRVTAVGGEQYEGRLRWGGGEEAFWGDYFNGVKNENPWAALVPPGDLPTGRPSGSLRSWIARREPRIDLDRPFMARFGDIARIDAQGTLVRVTLKSGTAFDLDRLEAGDFDDGVTTWDATRGMVNLDSLRIRAIEFLPTPWVGAAAGRLHGTVSTSHETFTGFLQWDRQDCVGTDTLEGRLDGVELSLRFDTIRSIERRSDEGCAVTLLDGRVIALADSREIGPGNRGIYVDDARYGRVLVSWDALERVELSTGGGGSGLAYADFPPGVRLAGAVTTRDGHRIAGRLVYDLDESETTETLDAPSRGVGYTIPFGLIASIDVALRGGAAPARVILHSAGEILLERSGDLGDRNAGLLVFAAGSARPEHVPWTDVARIDFDRALSSVDALNAAP